MVHIRKYFRGMDLAHLISWKIPENGLSDLVPKVSETISELGLQGLPAALTINHGPAFIKHIKLPLAAMENLAQVVSYELDRFIPVAPEQVWFSFQIDQKTETEVHLILFAVRKKPVEECLKLLDAAGLKTHSPWNWPRYPVPMLLPFWGGVVCPLPGCFWILPGAPSISIKLTKEICGPVCTGPIGQRMTCGRKLGKLFMILMRPVLLPELSA